MLFLTLLLTAAAPNFTLPILGGDGRTIASAALLNPIFALTAQHATDGLGKPVFLRCGDGETIGFVVKESTVADLALIKLEEPCLRVDTVTLATRNPLEATWVLIQGYPAGGARKATSALVSSYERVLYQDGYRRHVMLLDGRVTGGNSGGPVLAKGILVGIISAGICYSVSACYGAAIPISDIRKFLGMD